MNYTEVFWLTARREHLGYTIEELATMIDKPHGTVARWERTKHVPTSDKALIHKLAKVLDMTVFDVLASCGFEIDVNLPEYGKLTNNQIMAIEIFGNSSPKKSALLIRLLRFMYDGNIDDIYSDILSEDD